MLRFKTCSDCRQFLANNSFYNKPSGAKDGLDNKCKSCRNAHNKAHYAMTKMAKVKLYLGE
jgi:hypothetical protein